LALHRGAWLQVDNIVAECIRVVVRDAENGLEIIATSAWRPTPAADLSENI
jgi:hypothetical protein